MIIVPFHTRRLMLRLKFTTAGLISCFSLILCIVSNSSFAAKVVPADELKKFTSLYPNDDHVVYELNKTVKIGLDGDQLSTTYHTLENTIYLMDNARMFGNRQVYHSKTMELDKLDAYTLVPGEKKYKKVEATEFKEADFTDASIFSDDSKETHFLLPQITKGAKTHLAIDYHLTDPRMLPMLMFSPYRRVHKAVLTVEVEDGVNVEITPFNLVEKDYQYTETMKGKTKIMVWTFENPTKFKSEGGAPGVRHFAQQLGIRVKSYQTSNGEEKVLGDLDDLHNWYCSFVSRTKEEFGSLQAISDSIVGNETEQYEKARKIYQWVQNNIRYIAFEEGDKGLMPAKATEVCDKRFGDCKGMSNALYQLLRAQGIDAHLAWVGTRDLPFSYYEFPTPNVDNHMICVATIDGQHVIMDGTNSKVPFGMVTPFIQGKEILVNNECEGYEIIKAPIISSDQNLIEQDITINLLGDTVQGTGKLSFYGYSAMAIKERFKLGPKKDWIEEFKGVLLLASNKFLLDSIEILNFDQPDQPLVFNYKFRLPNYATSVDDEVYLNLALDKLDLPEKLEEDRKLPVEWRFTYETAMTVTLENHDGFDLTSLPKGSSVEHPNFGHRISYQKSDGKVVRTSSQKMNTIVLDPAEFEAYNQYVTTQRKACAEQIVLKKIQ